MKTDKSQELYKRALGIFPGGVNSPVRAFNAVGGDPVFLKKGAGAYVWDADGNKYTDFVASWGPLILGHAHPTVHAAIVQAAAEGTTFGASTEREILLGEEIRGAFPSMEKMRFVSSGTEATMSALRLARGFTKRNKIVKVEGGYHGHADMLLVSAGSGAATLGIPGSAGVTEAAVADTLLVPYNDLHALELLFKSQGDKIASFIVEPVPGNMGLVLPKEGYLQGVRDLCTQHGVILIFDEVINGFRVGRGGAQGHYGVSPDLTCLGKIIGGGLPMGAYGGRKDILACISPDGPVYQAGTLSGNPLAMAAGLAALKLLTPDAYAHLNGLGETMARGLREGIAKNSVPAHVAHLGSAWTVFFCPGPVNNFEDAKKADTAAFGRFFHAMLDRGFYLPPAQMECGFVSLAHNATDIDNAIAASHESFASL